MKRHFIHLAIVATAISFAACNSTTPAEQQTPPVEEENTIINDSTAVVILENNGIKLTEVVSPEFPDAQLTLTTPSNGSDVAAGEVPFSFTVESASYQLGAQTADADIKSCANSSKGQHIHLILNNQPYSAHYESTFTQALEPGSYTALAFISRSYHESLKHQGAATLSQFTVGGAVLEPIDLEAPHLFYSRPKGSYEGEDINKVMLDFYLINTHISEEGNYVAVSIDDAAVFKITKWAPYFMEGLTVGEHTIKIQLMDKNDNPIEGPFNTEERAFSLVQ